MPLVDRRQKYGSLTVPEPTHEPEDMNPNGNPKNLKPFPPGVSGNPGGKPVGARNRINAKFLQGLELAFDEGGIEAIRKCRDTHPSAFVRAMAGLLPKEVQLESDPLAQLSDDQLEVMLALCQVFKDYDRSDIDAMVEAYEQTRAPRPERESAV